MATNFQVLPPLWQLAVNGRIEVTTKKNTADPPSTVFFVLGCWIKREGTCTLLAKVRRIGIQY
jgi:hypothetical protein